MRKSIVILLEVGVEVGSTRPAAKAQEKNRGVGLDSLHTLLLCPILLTHKGLGPFSHNLWATYHLLDNYNIYSLRLKLHVSFDFYAYFKMH